MPTFTDEYEFILPTPGGDDDEWAHMLNANWASVDEVLAGQQQQVDAKVPKGQVGDEDVTTSTGTQTVAGALDSRTTEAQVEDAVASVVLKNEETLAFNQATGRSLSLESLFLVDYMYGEMKRLGIKEKIKSFYCLALDEESASLTDLADPSRKANYIGGVEFEKYLGVTTNGVDGAVDTKFNLANDGYTPGDSHLFIWGRNNAVSNSSGQDVGLNAPSSYLYLWPHRGASGSLRSDGGGATWVWPYGFPPHRANFNGVARDGEAVHMYRQDSLIRVREESFDANAPSATVRLANSGSTYVEQTFVFFSIGEYLTPGEVSGLYNMLRTVKQTIDALRRDV